MVDRTRGLTKGEMLRFVLEEEFIWELGEAVPAREPGSAGRPRQYPEWVMFLFDAMVTIHTSARKASAEICERWDLIREAAQRRYPEDPTMWPAERPPARHHWQYAKKRLRSEQILNIAVAAFEKRSAELAVEVGLCDPSGAGSVPHPDERRVMTGDGKVIAPLYKAKRGTPRVDRATGEIVGRKKADPTAELHVTGGGHPAYGNKFVMIATRGPEWHSRIVLSVDHVAGKGAEVATALGCVERIRPRLPGAQALLYDGAMRGSHHRKLMREAGLPVISPPTAAKAEAGDAERVEKRVFIETLEVDGELVHLYALGGQLGLLDFDGDGNEVFVPLARVNVLQRRNLDDTSRWYGEYRLPPSHGSTLIRVRADTTEEDRRRGLNRSENFRLFPPGDPDYERLYSIRSDIESNNRQLDDTLWLGRAHSVGAEAQLLDLLGYGLVFNSVASALARERRLDAQAA